MRLATMRILGFGLALLCWGQGQRPTYRAGTKLVEVTVTVLDRKGHPVADLAESDFKVLDAGKPRPIALFRFEGVTEVQPVPRALPPGVFTNRMEIAGGPPRNITALVLDSLNTPSQYNAVVRAQTMRYLKVMAPETRVAIFLMGQKLRVLHDFTDDAGALRARLDKLQLGMPLESVSDFTNSIMEAEQFVDMFSGDPAMQAAMEEMMRNQLEVEMMANAAARRSRMERTLAAMEALGQHLSGIPGRKNLVWISGGISMLSITGANGMGPRGSVDDYEAQVRETSHRLAQQGITLYIVDAHGLQTQQDLSASYRSPLPVRGRGRFEPQMDSEQTSNDPFPAMSLMASITGGRYLYNTNDLVAGLRQAVSDLRGSYTLGFYVPEEADDKWHKIKVRVARSGVNVHHRDGYFSEAATPQPRQWNDEMWRSVIANPLGSSAIRMTVACQAGAPGEFLLTLQIASDNLHFHADGDKMRADLDVAVVGRASDGRAWPSITKVSATYSPDKLQQIRNTGILYRRPWKPDAAATALRVIVSDAAGGHYGTLDIPLKKIPPKEPAAPAAQ